MATKSNSGNGSAGASVPPFAIAGAVVALVLVLGWFAYQTFGISREYAPPAAPPSATSVWIRDMAKQSGGDINRLSPEDRTRLQQITRGMGERALKGALQSR